MARLVAAFGSSHSPALNSPREDFPGHVRRDEQFQHHLDRDGRRTTYAALVRDADPSIARQIDPAVIAQRVAQCGRHLEALKDSIAAARLDALVISCTAGRPSQHAARSG